MILQYNFDQIVYFDNVNIAYKYYAHVLKSTETCIL